jgi:hypothetical protein
VVEQAAEEADDLVQDALEETHEIAPKTLHFSFSLFLLKPLRTLARRLRRFHPTIPASPACVTQMIDPPPPRPVRPRMRKCNFYLILRAVKRYTTCPVYCVWTQRRPGAGLRIVP